MTRQSRPKLNSDYTATVGLTREEMDRLLAEADADSVTSSALIRLEFIDELRVGSVLPAHIEQLG